MDIPEKYRAEAEEYRHQLLEAASHADDHLLELVLEGQDDSRGDAAPGDPAPARWPAS